ncbi:hypothetical protein R1flu_020671 [Riccia fluitans]|uniref:NADH-ubiquinone oxidoreductase B15 subunit n=1 Tax=Riccia fluitans TaxID=41844 RepID=A0ABD1ZM59_9MARC
MAGGMDVHKNKFIEQWATNRENLEYVFRFNRRTVPICVFFGMIVPFVTYQGITAEFHKQDQLAGRGPRKFL